jgi:hypothetical protein
VESEFIFVGSYYARQVEKPRTRWEDVIRMDTLQILGMREDRRRAEDKKNGGVC